MLSIREYKKSQFSLSERMRGYENVTKIKLTKRLPVIINIKVHIGDYPERKRVEIINNVSKYVADRTDSCEFTLITNNTISLLLNNYNDIDAISWENNDLQAIVSQAVTMSTRGTILNIGIDDICLTTATAFTIPKDEVTNYMMWKQNDLIREFIITSIVNNKVGEIKSVSVCNAMHMKMGDMLKLLNDNISSVPYDDWQSAIKHACFGYYYFPNTDEFKLMQHIKSNKSIIDDIVYDKLGKNLKFNKENNQ